jgi:PilZ domain
MAVQPQSFEPPAVWMTVGSAVTLLPVDLDTGLLTGEITHWLSGAAGLVATIGVRTAAHVAAMCAGHRLWLSGHEAAHGDLLVFEVIARKPSFQVDTTLALTGVVPLAHELRRSSVRASTLHPVRLTFEDGTTADGVAADLSRSGCRIALNEADLLRPVGTSAAVMIELPGNENFQLSGDIVRATGDTGELALHFRPTDIDLASIDRLVYATVKRQYVTGE